MSAFELTSADVDTIMCAFARLCDVVDVPDRTARNMRRVENTLRGEDRA